MAQKRMLDKKISVSEKVANLPIEGQLLFTWMIPHADDLGLLPGSARTLKALVIPMLDVKVSDVEKYIKEMITQKLITTFEYDGEKYYHLESFEKNQTLKRDRHPSTILSIKLQEDKSASWKACYQVLESNGIHMETNGIQTVPEGKTTEGKESQGKSVSLSVGQSGLSGEVPGVPGRKGLHHTANPADPTTLVGDPTTAVGVGKPSYLGNPGKEDTLEKYISLFAEVGIPVKIENNNVYRLDTQKIIRNPDNYLNVVRKDKQYKLKDTSLPMPIGSEDFANLPEGKQRDEAIWEATVAADKQRKNRLEGRR